MYFDETAWVAIAFILFFVLVWKRGKKAILSLLDERSLLIEKELNEAKSLKEEALEELRLALQNQKNVSDVAENLIKDAKETAKKIQEEANLKSLEMIKRKEEQAKQKILSLEAEAIKNIKEITSSIVIESSRTYIKEKLDNKENINLILKSSNEIRSSILK
jgi:F-type H+-transporting ATPase subunit b